MFDKVQTYISEILTDKKSSSRKLTPTLAGSEIVYAIGMAAARKY